MAVLRQQPHSQTCCLQVPGIVSCICTSLMAIRDVSAQQSLHNALVQLTCMFPREMVKSLLCHSPSCNK